MSVQCDDADDWMPWDASYELGIPVVDHQHRHLVFLCNKFRTELVNHSSSGNGGWQSALVKVLKETAQYTKTHFATEEKLMQASGYPNFEYHRRCHQEFVETVTTILGSFQSATRETAFEFASYLKEWILTHIAYEDGQFQQCILDYCRRTRFGVANQWSKAQ